MTYLARNEKAINDYLSGLNDSQLIAIHNEYCEQNKYHDLTIYENGEDFLMTFFENKQIELIRLISKGYNPFQKYVRFTGQGTLDTFDDAKSVIDINAISNDLFFDDHSYNGIEMGEEEED